MGRFLGGSGDAKAEPVQKLAVEQQMRLDDDLLEVARSGGSDDFLSRRLSHGEKANRRLADAEMLVQQRSELPHLRRRFFVSAAATDEEEASILLRDLRISHIMKTLNCKLNHWRLQAKRRSLKKQ